MSDTTDEKELLAAAREKFRAGHYPPAEAILNQLVLRSIKDAEIFQMLGTIYYDQGKFNKAIRAFRRALEIDPAFTDASVGLSIILNDLGRYDEGKKVFEEAKTMLAQRAAEGDPYINEKLAMKHDELGELYFQYNRYAEALEQYFKALNLSRRKPEITMKIVEGFVRLEEFQKAIKFLKELCFEYPDFHGARLRLGKLCYDSHQIPEAVEQWETVLRKDPENRQAKDYLRLATAVEVVNLDPPEIENL